jgi:hypothetical protein
MLTVGIYHGHIVKTLAQINFLIYSSRASSRLREQGGGVEQGRNQHSDGGPNWHISYSSWAVHQPLHITKYSIRPPRLFSKPSGCLALPK